MIEFISYGRNTRATATGGAGCLLFTLLGLAAFFFGMYWLMKFLWWASPGIVALALLLHWRSVADTGTGMLRQLRTNPVGAVLMIGLAVVFFPLFSLYLLSKAAMTRRLERIQQNLEEQGFGPQPFPKDDGFTDYEEIESTPKRIGD